MLEIASLLGVDYINVNNAQKDGLSGGLRRMGVAGRIEGYEVVPGVLVFNLTWQSEPTAKDLCPGRSSSWLSEILRSTQDDNASQDLIRS